MISVTIFEDQENVTGFKCIGHAGYAETGSDIICAGVSTLVINTINSIEVLTDSLFSVDTKEDSGLIDFKFLGKADKDAELLIQSMILGLQGIQQDYGNEYIILNFKEV